MIDKKKMHFIQLSLIFGAIIILTLMYEWGRPQALQTDGMMNQSMGGMMTSMHLSNVTVSDLIYQEEMQEAPSSMGSYHSSEQSELGRLNYFITVTIVVLLPFIIAGTIFLSIVWLK